MWHDNILGTIGETPLVRVNQLTTSVDVTVLAKVESFNPGSSVKDRIGLKMIEAAEADGTLTAGGTIVEGTSGNTGAGLALVAIAKGYRCIFTTQDKQSPEKADVLRALGAEVLVCPTNVAPDDPRSYYSVAKRLSEEIPNSVYLNQYENPANREAHYESTGPELWEGTDGRISHLVVASGTGGTVSGAGAFLKEQKSDIKIIGVDPYGSVYYKYFHTREYDQKEIYPYVTEGAGEDILAGNMDFDLLDDYVRVTDKDTMVMTRRLAREEGIFAGQSSGMAMAGALQWLTAHRDELSPEDVIVVILPDTGFRYLSKTFNDAWMRNHGFLDIAMDLTVSQVLAARNQSPAVVTVSPDATLGEAADQMAKYGISQLPVSRGSEITGSLTEIDILNRLIEKPDSHSESVGRIMGDPLPVVPRNMHLQQLMVHLGESPGAVLISREDGTYDIITKSDLISTLSSRVLPGQNATES